MRIETSSGYQVEDTSTGIDVRINDRFIGEVPYTSISEYELDEDDDDAYETEDEETGETFYYDDEALEKKIESYLDL